MTDQATSQNLPVPAEPDVLYPTREALELAALIKDRLGRRKSAPVRTVFIRNLVADGGRPPLADLLRSGRASDVRVGLFLSFLWFAAAAPFDLAYPARAWAALLGLDDPTGNGTRRVRQAMSVLADAKLISITARAGQPSRVVLLEESGEGRPYTLPGETYNRVRNTPEEGRHRYIQIPDTFWTNGWISVLSGPAIAMFLVLLTERAGRAEDRDLWVSPSMAKAYYAISDETRSRGLRELRAAGLVTARRASIGRDPLDFQRVRNTYRLVDRKLDERAKVPVNPEPDAPMRPGEALIADWAAQLTGLGLKKVNPPTPAPTTPDADAF
ncbi:MAG TPA: hypothetical protein VGK17_08685 [Propionicimonas sp.]